MHMFGYDKDGRGSEQRQSDKLGPSVDLTFVPHIIVTALLTDETEWYGQQHRIHPASEQQVL
jgi:hypothetical protein